MGVMESLLCETERGSATQQPLHAFAKELGWEGLYGGTGGQSLLPTAKRFSPMPTNIVPDHYAKVLTQLRDFWSCIRNSIVVTSISLFMMLLLASLVGYGFARYEVPGSGACFLIILFVISSPYVVYLIPILIIFMRFNLLDTTWGLFVRMWS